MVIGEVFGLDLHLGRIWISFGNFDSLQPSLHLEIGSIFDISMPPLHSIEGHVAEFNRSGKLCTLIGPFIPLSLKNYQFILATTKYLSLWLEADLLVFVKALFG